MPDWPEPTHVFQGAGGYREGLGGRPPTCSLHVRRAGWGLGSALLGKAAVRQCLQQAAWRQRLQQSAVDSCAPPLAPAHSASHMLLLPACLPTHPTLPIACNSCPSPTPDCRGGRSWLAPACQPSGMSMWWCRTPRRCRPSPPVTSLATSPQIAAAMLHTTSPR
jgi:hypothetical protein